MSSKHDHESGYVLLDSETNALLSPKVYRSMAGLKRSRQWREDATKVRGVCKEHYDMYYAV